MICVTNINNKEIVINSDFIECIEETPDTIVTLTTGRKIIVKEDVDELIERIVTFKRSLHK